MKIELIKVTIAELVEGYKDSDEEGVVAYGGRLNVRPKYQREFVYKRKEQEEVIRSVKQGFPLNVMYWAKNEDNTFELLDGQQRTLSICRYVARQFSVDGLYIDRYDNGEKDPQVMNYDKLLIYVCEGTNEEKLDWFRTINIAGLKLTDQELRNATYTGLWLTDAKRHFSKSRCVAMELGGGLVKCEVLRQGLLELVLRWITLGGGDKEIKDYMGEHQHDESANALWVYFQKVVAWVKTYFPKYRKEMQGLPWGEYYNEFHSKELDSDKIGEEIDRLMADDEVENKRGIYAYVLTREQKHLNLRAFDRSTSRSIYEQQKGICPDCGEHFEIEEMEADHIVPWHLGGRTVRENCQMLCRSCNRKKQGKLVTNLPKK